MSISKIVNLAEVILAIQAGLKWIVATQTHPKVWSEPDKDLQWYIDANWLIRVDELIHDPRA